MKPFSNLPPNLSLRLRQLDYLPPWLAISAGVTVGLLIALALIATHPITATVGVVALLGGALLLAHSGEPISIVLVQPKPAEPEPEPEPEPLPLPEMVPIPAGTFVMGEREVTISAFECMATPVTRHLYQTITGNDPGWPEENKDDDDDDNEDDDFIDERPINNVTWYDAVRFCNELSQREGLTPCYQLGEEDKENKDEPKVSWNPNADGFRLPTEAEWEYACRAGTDTQWYCGDDEDELQQYAWFKANSEDTPHPVGQKLPNAWRLYDMHGNVWEWCWDWFEDYPEQAQRDPVGPDNGGGRVLRGGAFSFSARDLRSAYRFRLDPRYRYVFLGFRCVRGSRRQP